MTTTFSVEEIHSARRANGPATILAIGKAVPSHFIKQDVYPDFYFGITNTQHMTDALQLFNRICAKSMIKKRHTFLTEEILKENPNFCDDKVPSLDARQDMAVVQIPKLGEEAALKAINEWGQPRSLITHLLFCTATGVDIPGADHRLAHLLGLRPSVNRLMMYSLGCYAGATLLRLAKDIAENNAGARVLAVSSEVVTAYFRGPDDAHPDYLVAQALFGEGAAAMIVGSDHAVGVERPLFQLVSAEQTTLPESRDMISSQVREVGYTIQVQTEVPSLISKNIEKCLVRAFHPLGIHDWNSLFWISHPGGRVILDRVEEQLGLKPEKLRASRRVMSEYGNMSSASVLFVLDEMRKVSEKERMPTTGEGLDWGVLFGFGPGLTIETVVLHSMPIN